MSVSVCECLRVSVSVCDCGGVLVGFGSSLGQVFVHAAEQIADL